MRRLAAIVVITIGCAILGAALAETIVRVRGYGRQAATADEIIGYRLTSGFTRKVPCAEAPDGYLTLRTNNLGLRRDVDTDIEKPAGTARVLLVGDADTEGIVANADTYASRLEESLQRDGSVRVEVLDAGVSGYSPLLALLLLREWGARLHPDVVVLALSSGSDLAALTRREAGLGDSGPRYHVATLTRSGAEWSILPPGAPARLDATDAWLQARLQSYDLLRSRFALSPAPQSEAIAQVAARCPGCMRVLSQQWAAQQRPGEYGQAALELRYVLDQVRALATALRARPLVIVIPTRLEVETDTVAADIAAAQGILSLHTAPLDFAQSARAQMLAACATRRLEVEDLTPALKQAFAKDGRPLFWEGDWQLNPAGHRAVAEALRTRLATAVRPR